MTVIYSMYHQNVSQRFMPSINASYKFSKDEDVEIRLPMKLKNEASLPSDKVSKKGSEE